MLWTVSVAGRRGARYHRRCGRLRRSGLQRSTICCWPLTTHPVQTRRGCLRPAAAVRRRQTTADTPILRPGSHEPLDVRRADRPSIVDPLYFVLAAVGIFTLLVGGAVRLRRPRDPATLHFLWLAVAFFGVFTFSLHRTLQSARLDLLLGRRHRDAGAAAAVPALHDDLSRTGPRRWSGGRLARAVVDRRRMSRRSLLGAGRVVALVLSERNPEIRRSTRSSRVLDRADYVYLAACVIGGLIGLGARALAGLHHHRPASAALDRVGHGARWRSVRDRYATALRVRRQRRDGDAAVGDPAQSHSAGVRVGDRPLSAARHRDHRQAHVRLRRRRCVPSP